MVIKIQGKEHPNVEECAKQHNLSPSTLSGRIERLGIDSTRLFEKANSYSKRILVGEEYESLADAARLHNIPVYVLRKNISRFGQDDPRIFKRNPRRNPIVIEGESYPDLKAISEEFEISINTLKKRINERKAKGLPLDKSILKPTRVKQFTFKGKTYKSTRAFLNTYPPAKKSGITQTTFKKRLKEFGEDREDLIFVDAATSKARRFPSFTYRGEKYENLNQFAKHFGIDDPRTIEGRLKLLEQDDPHLILDSKSYAKWLTTEEGHQAYINKAKTMFPLEYQGIKYASLKVMAQKSGVDTLSLSKRLLTQGLKSKNLLRIPNHTKHKELPTYRIDGHTFITKKLYIEYLVKKTGVSYITLYRRIKKYGVNDPRVLYSGKRPIVFKVKIKNKYYFNIGDISNDFNLSANVLRRRIEEYGLTDPDLVLPISEFNKVKGLSMARRPHKIVYQGHEFKSIREMAKFYDVDNTTLSMRIRNYGLDYEYLLSDGHEVKKHAKIGKEIEYQGKKYASYADMARKNNITVSKLMRRLQNNQDLNTSTDDLKTVTLAKLRKQRAHKNQLLTAEEVADKTGYNLDRLKSLLNSSTMKKKADGLLDLNQFVTPMTSEDITRTIYAYDPEIVPFIQKYFKQINDLNLVMIPQLRQMYFWAAKHKALYSLNPRTGSFRKKVMRTDKIKDRLGKEYKSQPYFSAQLVPGAKGQSKYTVREIESLIAHPEIVAEDLVTIVQLQNSHPEISKRKLTSTTLKKYNVPIYKRHFTDGRVITGYLAKDVKKLFFDKINKE